MSAAESRYIEKKSYQARSAPGQTLALRQLQAKLREEEACQKSGELDWSAKDLAALLPYLRKRFDLEFRGRILEIGAGGAWLSAELSKQPKVVEVIATDVRPEPLREQAPKVFRALNANAAKITRMPADFHQLDFPDNHFDFVVCSAVLQHAASVVQVLREAKRVLKPGGQFVALREPIWPRMKLKSSARKVGRSPGARQQPLFTLSHYRELFKQAGLPAEVKSVNLSRGLKYYVNEMVNGLTHARYAFVGAKRLTAPAKK